MISIDELKALESTGNDTELLERLRELDLSDEETPLTDRITAARLLIHISDKNKVEFDRLRYYQFLYINDRKHFVEYAEVLANLYYDKNDILSAEKCFKAAGLHYLKHRNDSKFDGLFLDLIEKLPGSIDMFMAFADQMELKNDGKRAAECLGLLVPALEEKKDFSGLLAILRRIIALGSSESLAGLISECYTELNKNNKNIANYLKWSRLLSTKDLKSAMEKIDRLLYYDEGEYFIHPRWNIGKVTAVDPLLEKIKLQFKDGVKDEFTLKSIPDLMKKVEKKDIRAMAFDKKEEFAGLMAENPAEAAGRYISCFGSPAAAKDMKDYIIKTGIMKEPEWARWWADAKIVLKKNPMYRLTGSAAAAVIEKREAPGHYIDEMFEEMKTIDTISRVFDRAKSIIKTAENAPEALARSLELFYGIYRKKNNKFYTAEMEYIQKVLKGIVAKKEEEPIEFLRNFMEKLKLEDLKKGLDVITLTEAQKWLLHAVQTHKEDWPVFFMESVPYIDDRLWDYVTGEIFKKGKDTLFYDYYNALLSAPEKAPVFFVGEAKGFLRGDYSLEKLGITRFRLFEKMLWVLNNYDILGISESNYNGLKNHFTGVFGTDDYSVFSSVLGEISREEVKSLFYAISQNRRLSQDFISKIEREIVLVFSDFFDDRTGADIKLDAGSSILFTTEEKFNLKVKELDNLIGVQIPSNSKVIEEAAAHGDLRENAEYVAAREKQVAMQKTAFDLKSQLDRARIIDFSKVDAGKVSIGTRVTLISEGTGEVRTYIILGPWEADTDKNIISYFSELASKLLGKAAGEQIIVPVDGGTDSLLIKNIDNASAYL